MIDGTTFGFLLWLSDDLNLAGKSFRYQINILFPGLSHTHTHTLSFVVSLWLVSSCHASRQPSV